MTKRAIMEEHSCRLGGKMCLHEMEEHTLTELDSLVDWQIVSHMVDTYGYWPDGPPDGADAPLPKTSSAVPTSPIGRPKEGLTEKLAG